MINSIENYGYTNTMINKNNKKSNVSMEWMGNYDGNIADLTVKLNNNGSKKVLDLKLDNEDLINLLNIPSHQNPLDERIRDTYLNLNQEPLHIIELPIVSLPTIRKKKRKTRNKRSKLRSRTKKILDLL